MVATVVFPYLKQPLFFDQRAFLQSPEIEMRLSTSHNNVAVSRVKVCRKHRLIGALNRFTSRTKNKFSSAKQHQSEHRSNPVPLDTLTVPWPLQAFPLSASPTRRGRGRWSHPQRKECFLHSNLQENPHTQLGFYLLVQQER